MHDSSQQIYIIDGNNFRTLEEFWLEVEIIFANFIDGVGCFGRNLDAFRDILCVAKDNTIVIWKNSKLSLQTLNYSETIRQLEKRVAECHPSNIDLVKKEIKFAKMNRGEIVFDWLIEIFLEEENIELRLE
jgi:RNAse (barnase) inhibitor barstar